MRANISASSPNVGACSELSTEAAGFSFVATFLTFSFLTLLLTWLTGVKFAASSLAGSGFDLSWPAGVDLKDVPKEHNGELLSSTGTVAANSSFSYADSGLTTETCISS